MSTSTFAQNTSQRQDQVVITNAATTQAYAVTVLIDWSKVNPKQKSLAIAALQQIENAITVYNAPAS